MNSHYRNGQETNLSGPSQEGPCDPLRRQGGSAELSGLFVDFVDLKTSPALPCDPLRPQRGSVKLSELFLDFVDLKTTPSLPRVPLRPRRGTGEPSGWFVDFVANLG